MIIQGNIELKNSVQNDFINNINNSNMKFTVEIDEFWLDEDSNGFEEELKNSIKIDVCQQIKK